VRLIGERRASWKRMPKDAKATVTSQAAGPDPVLPAAGSSRAAPLRWAGKCPHAPGTSTPEIQRGGRLTMEESDSCGCHQASEHNRSIGI